MSGSEIKVSYSGLATAAADINGSMGRLDTHTGKLESDLAPLVVTWEGEAALMYQETQRQWNTAAAELNEILRQVGAKVAVASESYQQADNRARNNFA